MCGCGRRGAVWVTNYRTGSLLRVDPSTRKVRRTLVGGGPFDVLVADGSVWTGRSARPRSERTGLWVPDKEIDTVFRVDPANGEVLDSFPGGDGAFQAIQAFGSVWVTSYAAADVWRFRDGR